MGFGGQRHPTDQATAATVTEATSDTFRCSVAGVIYHDRSEAGRAIWDLIQPRLGGYSSSDQPLGTLLTLNGITFQGQRSWHPHGQQLDITADCTRSPQRSMQLTTARDQPYRIVQAAEKLAADIVELPAKLWAERDDANGP